MTGDTDTYLHEVCEEREDLRAALRLALPHWRRWVLNNKEEGDEEWHAVVDAAALVDGRMVGRRAVQRLRRECAETQESTD